jgi:hypothetical protein
MLFVRSHFVWAEIMIIINWFNLSSLYYRHNTYARFIHAPVVSGPLAWTTIALFWNGAMMVYHPGNTVARIFGNIFIWVIFLYGMGFVSFYKVSCCPSCVRIPAALEILVLTHRRRTTQLVSGSAFSLHPSVLTSFSPRSLLSSGSLPLSSWPSSSWLPCPLPSLHGLAVPVALQLAMPSVLLSLTRATKQLFKNQPSRKRSHGCAIELFSASAANTRALPIKQR